MTIQTFSSTCTELTQLTKDVWQFRFQKPDGLNFIAGQYLLFQVPLVENPNDIQPRAYSIASGPDEDDLLFIAKVFPGGRFSEYLLHTLRPGVTMKMQGPLGRFVLGDTADHHLMLATGTGLAPFRSQILELTKKADKRPIDLLFCVRSEDDLFWLPEAEKLMLNYGNGKLHVMLSDGSASWNGLRGRVQDHVLKIRPDVRASKLFACGNPQMTLDVKKLAVEVWGMKKDHVHVEGYV